MLTVAAARLESDYANPKLIADLRAAAKEAATAHAEGRGYTPDDEKRIERQRTLFAMLPSCSATDRLKERMLQRAYDLMWGGDCSATDAIAEFLPSKDVDRMFEAWENDQVSGNVMSPFHAPKD
jgi:hypothetical protein